MNVLIIEDEQHNARMLADMLRGLRPGWRLCGMAESVRQSVELLRKEPQPDLVLMDIQLSDGICFSIFKQVNVRSRIIFTTAFDHYAVQAFRVNSIDYLLKPVKTAELERALDKFERMGGMHPPGTSLPVPDPSDHEHIMRAILSGRKEYRKRFLISTGSTYQRLDTRDIACFTSENKITTAHTFRGDQYVVDFSLDRLEEELDPADYFRADRRTIIHIDLVGRFEDYFGGKLVVRLKAPVNDRITVSRLKAAAFKVWTGK